MKKKNLLTLSVGCLLVLGGMSLAACNSTPAKNYHTITLDVASGATVNGLREDKKYEKDEVVQFTISITDSTKYGVDQVTVTDSTVTKSGSNYLFGMPDEDVTLTVTLRDIRDLSMSFSADSVEVDEHITYTVTCSGTDVTSKTTVSKKADSGEGIVFIDSANGIITGGQEGTLTLVATYDGLTYEKTLTVNKSSKLSIEDAEKAALEAGAKKKSTYSGVAYYVPGTIVYKGAASSSGYSDSILYDGNKFLVTYTNKATTDTIAVGDVVIAHGELQNYYGLFEMAFNSKGTVKTMEFIKDSTRAPSTPTPVDMSGAEYDAYYTKGQAASNASSSADGNTYDNIVEPAYIKATATVILDTNGVKQLKINDATHYLNLSPSAANEAKALVEASPVGCEMTVVGYLEGVNTTTGYSKFLLETATVNNVDVTSVTLSCDKEEVNYGSTATLTATVDPVKGATQYGVTYTASPADAVSISADGVVTPKIVSEDTEVSITATCKDVTSEPIKLTVKKAEEGEVVITSTVNTTEVDMTAQLTAIVVGQETPTLTWASSNEGVATVDATGKVTAKAVGTTTITVTCGEKSTTLEFSVTERVTPYHAGTEKDPYTATDAYLVAKALTSGTYTESEVYLKANVSNKGTYSESYNNYTNAKVTDGNTTFTIYRMALSSDVTVFYIGDEVVVKGYLQNYNGTSYQMTNNGTSIPTVLTRTAGTSTISVSETSSEDVTIAGLPETATNGDTVSFTVTLKGEVATTKEIKSVSVNDTELTASEEGTYSFVVDGPSSIKVETKNAGEVDPTVVTAAYSGTTTTSMDGQNQAVLLGVNDENVSIVGEKNNGGANSIGLNKDGTFRFYKNSTAKMTISVTNATIQYLKITFGGTVGELTVNGKSVEVSANSIITVQVNAGEAVLLNTHASTQTYIKSIAIAYLPTAPTE